MSQKPFEPSSSVVEKMKHVVGLKKRQQSLQEKMRSLVQEKQHQQALKANPPKQVPIVLGPRAGRNDPCPCGSGKKYKKCCLLKEKAA